MGKTRGVHETTPELRNRMVGMYEAGLGLREIAAAINCSQRTVKRWLNRFDKEGTVETRERCGRKRATTSEQDEAIVRLATQTTITAAKAVLPALGLSCSVDTVRERLHKAGIHNWSPCRKHMQKIPLGNEDGSTIQQAVWRPTGTQLGKKKNPKDGNKSKKSVSTKKKLVPRKARAKDIFIGDGAPAESLKQTVVQQQNFAYPQESVHQQPSNEIPSQTLQPPQVIFANHLDLTQQPQPVYHHENWPLDLVQGSHHYSQGQPNGIQPNQHLQHMHPHQELHSQPEQQEANRQICSQMEEQNRQQNIHPHHHGIEQQPHQMDQVQQSRLSQTCLASSQDISKNCSDSNDANGINQMSNDKNSSGKESTEESEDCSGKDRKKKGGKVKGTLETSVEIRNRMIGMSEAGLSTLSIALAINRSERTVKRWLERWHKEGNVQTKERKGRRRITTQEEDNAIIAMATQYPLTAAKNVAPALGLKCSVDTVRERLHKAGIHSWKLGKKQGEGNAVHTVHLWQPSGNRPNKPKILSDKKKKSSSNKKRDPPLDDLQKRVTKKKKVNNIPQKTVPPPANMIPEQNNVQFQSQSTMVPYVSAPSIMQPLHTLSSPPTLPHSQSMPADQQVSPPCPTPMQPMGPIMQQRPDCRLVPTVEPPVSSQPNSINYPSCMVANNNQTSHMEQTDPLNYEPYIWSF